MQFPLIVEELRLHERVLVLDSLATVDLFSLYVEPLEEAVQRDLRCDDDIARDAAIDAIFEYLDEPSRYDSARGRLCTFLVAIGKRRAIDRMRSRSSEIRREREFSVLVELQAPIPKEEMEGMVDAERLWRVVEREITEARDRAVLALILNGERSTEVLAEALGIQNLPRAERQREVKRNRDRLMKVLERVGARLRDEY